MTKRPGDTKPDPAGGRALERLRMFEESRASKKDPKAKAPAAPSPRKKRR